MYVPKHFKEDSLPVLHNFIRDIGFGTLVTMNEVEIEASHLPMLLDESKGSNGTLYGHMARANQQWQRAKPDAQALAIFVGPNSYISPAWYPSKRQTGKVVPTWNYIAIHAYGCIAFYDDASELREHVGKLTELHEHSQTAPWSITDAPPDYIETMLKGIVGFRLTLTRLEGKWKLSQNRTPTDMAGVQDALTAAGGEDQRILAGMMRARVD